MRSTGRRSRCLRYEQKGIKAFLKVDRLAATRRSRAGRRTRKISGRETAFSTRWGVAVATVPPAAPEPGFNLVTKHAQNISRQFCRSGLRDGGRRLQGFQFREPWIASTFKAPTLQSPNEILHCFNRNSVSWSNLDIFAYKRFGTKAVAHTRAAPERAS